ncbi:uncharacterized protein [Rutidosis leptorrhynchoides]|uniref:uncharacterized protein n=1 Tax=Rutidosis leptorrhynchoides TaxID=125765 RepID=UPI003A99BD88
MARNPLISNREDMVEMAGYGEEKLSTVTISGSVLCDARLHQGEPRHELPVQGALVGVHCQSRGKGKSISCSEAETDEVGDFLIDLPSHLHATPNLEDICSVKVLRLPKTSPCRRRSAKNVVGMRKPEVYGLKLASLGNGIRTYKAGKLKLHHHSTSSSSNPSTIGNIRKNIIKKWKLIKHI